MAAIGAHDEIGADFKRPLWRLGQHAHHAPIRDDEIGRARLHAQVKARIAARVLG